MRHHSQPAAEGTAALLLREMLATASFANPWQNVILATESLSRMTQQRRMFIKELMQSREKPILRASGVWLGQIFFSLHPELKADIQLLLQDPDARVKTIAAGVLKNLR